MEDARSILTWKIKECSYNSRAEYVASGGSKSPIIRGEWLRVCRDGDGDKSKGQDMGDQGGTMEISGCSCEAWWSQEFLEKQIEGRKSKEKNSHDSFSIG